MELKGEIRKILAEHSDCSCVFCLILTLDTIMAAIEEDKKVDNSQVRKEKGGKNRSRGMAQANLFLDDIDDRPY